MQTISSALAGMVLIAGKRSAMRIPKIAMTTINSMSVNPARKVKKLLNIGLIRWPTRGELLNSPFDHSYWGGFVTV